MPEKQNIIKNRIHDYLEGRLRPDQVDELWAGLLGDDQAFEYMETLALLKKMGAEGQFADVTADENEFNHTNKIQDIWALPYLRVAAAMAAVILLTVLTVYQADFLGNDVTSAPIASIDYGVERSGEIGDQIEGIKSHIIGMTDFAETEDAVLYLNDQLSNEIFTDSQVYELHILKGSIYYNSGMYEEAKSVFLEGVELVDQQANFTNYEKNLWYLANTLLQLGEKDQAIHRINEVILLDGSFARVAENLLYANEE